MENVGSWLPVIVNESLSTLHVTTEAAKVEKLPWLVWFACILSPYIYYFSTFGVFLALFGVILNIFVIDIARHDPDQTSGSTWMRYTAFWDIILLLRLLFSKIVTEIARKHFLVLHNVICKFGGYSVRVFSLNASAHLVAMTVDKALNITFPT